MRDQSTLVSRGGNMANLPDSTLDPVFWLHHGVVDFMFTFWQAGTLAQRKLWIDNLNQHQAWQYNNEKEHPTCRSCRTCTLSKQCYVVAHVCIGRSAKATVR